MDDPALANSNDDRKDNEKLKPHAAAAMKRHPELAALEHDWQRNQVAKVSAKSAPWIMGLLTFGAYFVSMATLGDLLRLIGIKSPAIAGGIFGCAAGACGSLLYFRLFRKRNARLIRQKINEFGMLVCVECGYQLKGTTESRCPECGQPFAGSGPANSE
ncbi:MAG: hypothetical protein DHS20C16_20540 [Phycisphaerae bacterium]|nr:MAG: hypothetical protein DHS20C16_20540 [Phycisphaerae bacterium]